MNTSKYNFLFILTLGFFTITSCGSDPVVPIQEELITTLNYTLTPVSGGTPIVLSFQDLDGDGGNAPIISGGTLSSNTIYQGSIQLLNESVEPVDNISDEVRELDLEHQFFFSTTVSGLMIDYTDVDAGGNPLGLESSITTTDAGSGTLTVVLRHEPNKTASGVSDGDITNAGGESDIEVTFDITVQ